MENEIQVFWKEGFGEIRTAKIDGEPWFVAADVCNALDIGNPSQAISKLDADEKLNTLISNEGNKRGNPNMTVVNEPGLYTLVLGSRKPEAKAFKRWITHEVIPAIRKTGTYTERPMSVAEQFLTVAKIQVELERRQDAMEKRTLALEESAEEAKKFQTDVTNIFTPFDPANWQEQALMKVREYCLANGLDYQQTFNNLYVAVQCSAHVDLDTRVKNRRKRILQNGGTQTDAKRATKLAEISNDPKLRSVFELKLKSLCVSSYASKTCEVMEEGA